MKRQTFNVLFFIRKTRTVKSGETPIMLRITIQGQLAEMQLKRTVKPELWSQAKERCTGKDSKSVEVNRYLESIKLRLYEIHRTLEDENKLINPMEIKRRFLGLDEKHKMFFEVFQEHNDKCRELIGKDYAKVTISRFDTCLKYFKEMLLKQYHLKDIPMKEINNAIIQDYIHFLYVQRGVKLTNTSNGRSTDIRTQSIDIPIELKWEMGISDDFDLFLGAGPSFSFLVDEDNWGRKLAHIAVDAIDKDLSSMGWRSTEVGLNLGGGVKIVKHLMVSCYYNIGLTQSAKHNIGGNKHDVIDQIFDGDVFESKNRY